MTSLRTGDDGVKRCGWGAEPEIYRNYHDNEWGRPVRGDDLVFERLTLEAFQSGLSWLTILRKRESFRAAFAGFAIDRVAKFGAVDFERLMSDPGIVRNRLKIAATISNAQAASSLIRTAGPGALDRLVWDHRPEPAPAPRSLDAVPAITPASIALARALKKEGFVFVGPTTAYAAMQAMGLVNDHVEGCASR